VIQHPISVNKQIEVLQQLKHTTTRQAEDVFHKASIQPNRPRTKEITLSLTIEQMDKVEQLKGLFAHQHPYLDFNDLFSLLLDMGLKQKLKEKLGKWQNSQDEKCVIISSQNKLLNSQQLHRESARCEENGSFKRSALFNQANQEVKIETQTPLETNKAIRDQTAAHRKSCKNELVDGDTTREMHLARNDGSAKNHVKTQKTATTTSSIKFAPPRLLIGRPKNPRAIPQKVKRFIWHRDQGKCTKCHSYHALEIDHIQPIAVNGDSNPDNMRLLCRSCNQRASYKTFQT
jgi:hypothetical protein